jgi:hypothetical protein
VSSSFVLTLDTQAPVVTWGFPDGTDQGEELRVPYAVNEPGIISADLELPDGRHLSMEVQPGVLVVQLPDDTPEGPATVSALVRDDVWNEATRTHVVQLTGEIAPPPSGPPVLPSPPQRRVTRVVSEPSICRGSSRDAVAAVVPTFSVVRTRSRYIAPTERTVELPGRLAVTAPPLGGRGALSGADTLWKRPEGPGAEEDFILLDLL